MRWRLALLLAVLFVVLPATGLAQDWSGASLRSAPVLQLPPGYRVDVVGAGFALPQDLAVDPPDGLWVLTQGGRAGGVAGALARLPLTGPFPVEAATLPAIPIPFSSDPARFRAGSLARHPRTGALYVAERLGRHIVRVTPREGAILYARGLNLLADTRSLAFDGEGRLLVLDYVGRSAVADARAGTPRELFGDAERDQGPVLYRLQVDEPLPLPRNLEYATPLFPPRGLRQSGAHRPRYVGMVALETGDLILSGSAGEIDRLRPDGALARVTQLPSARVVGVGPRGELYAADFLGGRIVRILEDGTVQPFVEGLARPAAVVVLPDGTLFVAEDTSRVLRLTRAAAGQ